jgi:Coenzyme PQQ synthesis protein D (PqqD)
MTVFCALLRTSRAFLLYVVPVFLNEDDRKPNFRASEGMPTICWGDQDRNLRTSAELDSSPVIRILLSCPGEFARHDRISNSLSCLWLSHAGSGNVRGIRTNRRLREGFKIVRVAENVRSTHSQDGGIVLDILHGQMFRLNFVGSQILELLKQGLSEFAIAEQLARNFGIDHSTAETNVREFFETLEKHGLLIARNSNP